MRKFLPLFCFCLLFLAGCAARAASLSAHSYVSSKVTWTYESTSATGQVILKISDGPQLVLPADHHFQKQFVAGKNGTFLYCGQCSESTGEVAAYLAPAGNDEVKKILAARADGGPGL